ncbi:hypothetical protein A2U01_0114935, partial [Trifolium medium]|nr:hypothetical protein [Trifolium medium]
SIKSKQNNHVLSLSLSEKQRAASETNPRATGSKRPVASSNEIQRESLARREAPSLGEHSSPN